MRFESKISGTAVKDFEITLIFNSQIVSLKEAMQKLHRQEAMDYLLDKFRFKLCDNGEWIAIISFDDDYKLAILENYPEYEKLMIGYFGEHWLNHYIRFNH